MSKSTIGVLVIVLVFGGYFLFSNKTEAPTFAVTDDPQTPQEVELSEENLPSSIPPQGTTTSALPDEFMPQTDETEVSRITYSNDGFSPRDIVISAGTTVTFSNESTRSMWVASNQHPTHRNFPELDQRGSGSEYSFTFEEAGTYNYHNHLRPSHGGTITVQ